LGDREKGRRHRDRVMFRRQRHRDMGRETKRWWVERDREIFGRRRDG
jgi:hypothetical protein